MVDIFQENIHNFSSTQCTGSFYMESVISGGQLCQLSQIQVKQLTFLSQPEKFSPVIRF